MSLAVGTTDAALVVVVLLLLLLLVDEDRWKLARARRSAVSITFNSRSPAPLTRRGQEDATCSRRSLVVELTRPGSSASTRTRNALGVGDLLDPRDRVGVQLHRRTEASKNPRTFSAVTEDLYRRSIRGEESPSDSRRLPNLNYVMVATAQRRCDGRRRRAGRA